MRQSLSQFMRIALATASLAICGAASAQSIGNIPRQQQTQSEWCWAATSSMVISYYNGNQTPANASQCKLATTYKDPSVDCCTAQNASNTNTCNKPGWPATVLYDFGELQTAVEGQMTGQNFAAVEREITAQRPVIGAVTWPDGSGHAILIYGIGFGGLAGGQALNIYDPATGAQIAFYNNNQIVGYGPQNNGKWMYTFFTKKPGGSLGLVSVRPPELLPKRVTIQNDTNYTVYFTAACDNSAWETNTLLPHTKSDTICNAALNLKINYRKSWLNGCPSIAQTDNITNGSYHFAPAPCGMTLQPYL